MSNDKARIDWIVDNRDDAIKLFEEYKQHKDLDFLYDCIDDAIEQKELRYNPYWEATNRRVEKELEGLERAWALKEQLKIEERNERIARKRKEQK